VIVATVVQAVWGLALSCCKRTPDDSNPRCFVLIAGQRLFFRRFEYDAPVTVVPLGVLSSKMTPFLSQKRVSIAFPADGSVRNFFGFGDEEWCHSLLALFISGWWT